MLKKVIGIFLVMVVMFGQTTVLAADKGGEEYVARTSQYVVQKGEDDYEAILEAVSRKVVRGVIDKKSGDIRITFDKFEPSTYAFACMVFDIYLPEKVNRAIAEKTYIPGIHPKKEYYEMRGCQNMLQLGIVPDVNFLLDPWGIINLEDFKVMVDNTTPGKKFGGSLFSNLYPKWEIISSNAPTKRQVVKVAYDLRQLY